jgi:hypothetical protein
MYWTLTKILPEDPDKSFKDDDFVKRVQIKILVPGKSNKYFATGWVNLHFNQCHGFMVANGELTIRQEGNEIGASLEVWNLPLGQSILKSNTDEPADLPLNKKTIFKGPKKPIHWVDIDGDGIDELILSSVCGVRNATHNLIYEYENSLSTPKFFNPIDLRYFDPENIPQTIIKTNETWSACGIRWETFESINGKYTLTEVSITDEKTGNCNNRSGCAFPPYRIICDLIGAECSLSSYKCVTETFKRREDGKLCLTQSQVLDGLYGEWIDTEVRDYSKEICRPLPK